jgi:anti-sigma B factor antagonist
MPPDQHGGGIRQAHGLSAIIGIWHAAQEAGGSLSLAAVPERLMRMLSMTGVDSLLPVHATTADVTDAPPASTQR